MTRVGWYGEDTFSWNPLAMRCAPVGAGCVNCWHLRMADRLAANPALSPASREAWAALDEAKSALVWATACLKMCESNTHGFGKQTNDALMHIRAALPQDWEDNDGAPHPR